MRVGLSIYGVAAPELVRVAAEADRLGFDSLWAGEHVIGRADHDSSHPTAPSGEHGGRPIVGTDVELLDPLVAFGGAATRTRTIQLCTGIYILPLRHPLLTARATATLHDLSGGRFTLGVGSGWLREEFEALDVTFDERGTRFDEALAILRLAWAGGPFSYEGRHFHFEDVQVCRGAISVPLCLGGNTERAMRRAAAMADGWFSSGTPTFDEALVLRDRLEALPRRARRRPTVPRHVPRRGDRRDRVGPLRRRRVRRHRHLVRPAATDRRR